MEKENKTNTQPSGFLKLELVEGKRSRVSGVSLRRMNHLFFPTPLFLG